MDTLYVHFLDNFLPITLLEIESDVGPYDDDGDPKQHCTSAHEVDRLLNVQT